MNNIKLYTLTNEYVVVIENGNYIKTDYTVNGNGRYIVTIPSGSYFIDQLN